MFFADPMKRANAWVTYLQVSPLALVFLLFLVVPIATIVAVSFWDYNTTQIIPAFLLQNYEELILSPVTWQTYLQTVEFAAITWVLTLVIGFTVAYFLSFHVQSTTWQMVLFLVCTIPFWTSNVIRMISWIPFLGRNGLANMTLIQLGLIKEPLEFLLFSDFSVVLAYVHLYTLFMVVPIFNSMMRIDRSLLEAARDAGGFRIVKEEKEFEFPEEWPRDLIARVIRVRFRNVVIINENYLLSQMGEDGD